LVFSALPVSEAAAFCCLAATVAYLVSGIQLVCKLLILCNILASAASSGQSLRVNGTIGRGTEVQIFAI